MVHTGHDIRAEIDLALRCDHPFVDERCERRSIVCARRASASLVPNDRPHDEPLVVQAGDDVSTDVAGCSSDENALAGINHGLLLLRRRQHGSHEPDRRHRRACGGIASAR